MMLRMRVAVLGTLYLAPIGCSDEIVETFDGPPSVAVIRRQGFQVETITLHPNGEFRYTSPTIQHLEGTFSAADAATAEYLKSVEVGQALSACQSSGAVGRLMLCDENEGYTLVFRFPASDQLCVPVGADISNCDARVHALLDFAYQQLDRLAEEYPK